MVFDDCDADEAGWGYCRPLGHRAGVCRDTPRDWKDSDGDSCGEYAAKGYCTVTGGYGIGWRRDWGSFANFSSPSDGRNATAACCNCGGGSVPHCHDISGWFDKEGDGCQSYVDYAWCNSTGGWGLGWHEEWGEFSTNADGIGPATACCHCGGGQTEEDSKQNTLAELQGGRRYTWNECECLQTWEEDGVGRCSSTCCNLDDDPLGSWCKVKDPACEDSADWGYCRTPDPDIMNTAAEPCIDTPDWSDPDGDPCESYMRYGWCNPSGTPGRGWHEDWGAFPAKWNVTAMQACCYCGGGDVVGTATMTTAATTTTAEVQALEHAIASASTQRPATVRPRFTFNGCRCKMIWEESAESKCETSCCNPDSDPEGEWCLVEDTDCEDQVVWGYCRPLGAEHQDCRNDPLDWRDSAGASCVTYEESGWCSASGGYGPFWSSSWGTFESLATNGRTADVACCGCGGGHMAEGCTDVLDWVDVEGDGCKSYRANQWCTSQGAPGKGWHDEWGRLPIGTGDIGPEQACCACGGGVRPGGAPALPQPGAPRPPPAGKDSAVQAAITYNGCACKLEWEDLGMRCSSSCCNPDSDPKGDWCFVQDTACEEMDWGYCKPNHDGSKPLSAPIAGSTSSCTDIEGWRDADGDKCEDYLQFQWCTRTGDYGLGWHEEWGSFRSFTRMGLPIATEACCDCGRGVAPSKVSVQSPVRSHGFASFAATSFLLVLVGGGGWCCGRRSWGRDERTVGMQGAVIGCKYQQLEMT